MYLSIRDAMLAEAGFESLAQGLNFLKLRAVELAVDRDMRVAPIDANWKNRVDLSAPADVGRYQSDLTRQQLRVSSLLLANDFSRADLESEIAWVIRCARLAAELGADSIRIDALIHEAAKTWTEEKLIATFISSMRRVIEATASLPVVFGIENHGAQGNEPDFLTRVIQGVGSPRLGNTLDTANFYWSGKPLSEVQRILQQFAPTTRHTHLKNIAYPAESRETTRPLGWRYGECCCPLPDGDIDLQKTIAWLLEAKYDSDLCIENEALGRFPLPDRPKILLREVQYLNRLLASSNPAPKKT